MTPDSVKEVYTRLERKEYERALALLEHGFDGKEAPVASCIGFIYSRRNSSVYDLTKAKKFYQIAAEQGDTEAQYALGGLLREAGNIDEALPWYLKASEAGESSCSYILYKYFLSHGEKESSDRYFNRAIEQGNPLAHQHQAMRHVMGNFGVIGVLKGIYMWIVNAPRLIKYVKNNF